MRKRNNRSKGFSLFEMILYVGLFGMILSGGILASYQLLKSSQQVNSHASIQEEENFVTRKILWAIAGMDPSQTFVPASGSSATLSLTRYDGLQIAIRRTGTVIELSENGGSSYLPLTTGNVQATALTFTHIPASGSGPEGITATLTIDGQTVTATRYIRK
jgi:hypothetical protein